MAKNMGFLNLWVRTQFKNGTVFYPDYSCLITSVSDFSMFYV